MSVGSCLLRGLTAVALAWLPVAPALAANWQSIASVSCDDSAFLIDGRPYARNEAGGSKLELRYRYRGLVLEAINFEDHYRNLDAWRPDGATPVIEYDLRLNLAGLRAPGGTWQRGDTLYVDPDAVGAEEFRALGECLYWHRRYLGNALQSTTISSRGGLLGMGTYRTTPQRDGIARLVHARSPLVGIYRHTGLLIVERSGQVLLRSNLAANSPAEQVVLGQVIAGRGTPVMRLREGMMFRGEPFSVAWLRVWRDHRGHRVADDYRIEVE